MTMTFKKFQSSIRRGTASHSDNPFDLPLSQGFLAYANDHVYIDVVGVNRFELHLVNGVTEGNNKTLAELERKLYEYAREEGII